MVRKDSSLKIKKGRVTLPHFAFYPLLSGQYLENKLIFSYYVALRSLSAPASIKDHQEATDLYRITSHTNSFTPVFNKIPAALSINPKKRQMKKSQQQGISMNFKKLARIQQS